ncbi:hypothetical protein [Actinokineospora fastidiosa]|uniref:Uncharacterized protein n=1 Tax=Actinokineospora fastidiosa TaxID=1816 RepID=A0A918GPA9_9PSEU|nr:hypothetical protein [Actinokineospora fastidiosa]GGS49378.1 hypothetical protein GCM10010171_50620 [Actinokineospora fastidiosa]
MITLVWPGPGLWLWFDIGPERPVRLLAVRADDRVPPPGAGMPLATGERLRYRAHDLSGARLRIIQVDPATAVISVFETRPQGRSVRMWTEVAPAETFAAAPTRDGGGPDVVHGRPRRIRSPLRAAVHHHPFSR